MGTKPARLANSRMTGCHGPIKQRGDLRVLYMAVSNQEPKVLLGCRLSRSL